MTKLWLGIKHEKKKKVVGEAIDVQSWSLTHTFFFSVSFEDHYYSEFVQCGSVPGSFTV